ncbi:MAG: IscS subfamily cysteine desulfurase [Planctomycetes bacterium]|nr:IscS subfamily cysteine desulfurase [Planctomycetota bacterium]
MKNPIYLDYQATTPLDERVLEAMLPYFREKFGNSASRNHAYGWEAEKAVDQARAQVAGLVGGDAKEIVFTSGATEANNLAIKGVAEMYREKGRHLISAPTEHKAVLDPLKRLEQEGCEVTLLPVDRYGAIRLEELARAIRPDTVLVSLMAANNEIGTLHPLAAIGKLCKERGVLFHTDATQGVGKIPLDVDAMGIDLLSLSGHKVYGPKGVGALYVRRRNPRVRLSPQLDGGGHERGMRSGTLNVPGIVGLGCACALARAELASETVRLTALRERLWSQLRAGLDEIHLNGHPTERLPGNLNVSFAYVEGEGLMMGMSELAVSSGSACTSASLEPSYVLKAIGVGDDLAHTSIRFGIGRFTTEAEVDFAAQRVVAAVQRLRAMSPLYEMAKEGIDMKSVKWSPTEH